MKSCTSLIARLTLSVITLVHFEATPVERYETHADYFHPKMSHFSLNELDGVSGTFSDEMDGGIYHQMLDTIIPFFPALIRAEWLNDKKEILERIGPIYPTPSKESTLWRNTATSIDDLINDAGIAAPYFWEKCILIANKTGSSANFGISDRNMIKSCKSIKRKVEEEMLQEGISYEEAVSKIRDALRGTIIAETPEQVQLIVNALKNFANEEGQEIVFINIWEDSRPSGYVGVHAKMLLPIRDAQGLDTQRNIIAEIQIHLRCVMDGTIKCVKERSHFFYEQARMGIVDADTQTSASTLLYLAALKNCPKRSRDYE
jgi:Region found in RelA / SpoT proteins